VKDIVLTLRARIAKGDQETGISIVIPGSEMRDAILGPKFVLRHELSQMGARVIDAIVQAAEAEE
jgi:hypothetical protein